MRPPSPRAIELSMSAAQQLRTQLPADDAALVLGTIEGETNALELLDRVMEAALHAEVMARMATTRAKQFSTRKDVLRQTALDMLGALDLPEPLQRALYTASIGYRQRALVTDATALPASVMVTKPDMRTLERLLKKGPITGAEWSNPEPHLIVGSGAAAATATVDEEPSP